MAAQLHSRDVGRLELVVDGIVHPLKGIAGCRIAPPPDATIAVPEGSALVTPHGRHALVKNLGNLPVFCGQRIVPPGQTGILMPGEVLQLGSVAILLRATPRPAPRRPALAALLLICAVCAGWMRMTQQQPAPDAPFDVAHALSSKHPSALQLFNHARLAIARGDLEEARRAHAAIRDTVLQSAAQHGLKPDDRRLLDELAALLLRD